MNFDYTKHNVGNTDRMIRVILGALLILGVILGRGWILGVIGAVLLATAYFRFCPAYSLFDFSSSKDATPVSK